MSRTMKRGDTAPSTARGDVVMLRFLRRRRGLSQLTQVNSTAAARAPSAQAEEKSSAEGKIALAREVQRAQRAPMLPR